MDVFDRMMELSNQGFFCSQILLSLALDMEQKENTDLIRAMGGLNGGLLNTKGVCGSLSGGMCFLSYFAGKGEADEIEHEKLDDMARELKEWFIDYTTEYGGYTCEVILDNDDRNKIQRCPLIVEAVFEKCLKLLELNGIL